MAGLAQALENVASLMVDRSQPLAGPPTQYLPAAADAAALQARAAAAVAEAQVRAAAKRPGGGMPGPGGCGQGRASGSFAAAPAEWGRPQGAAAAAPGPVGVAPGVDPHLAAAAAGSGPQAEQAMRLLTLQVLSQLGSGRGAARREVPVDFDDYAFRLLGGGAGGSGGAGHGEAGGELGGKMRVHSVGDTDWP